MQYRERKRVLYQIMVMCPIINDNKKHHYIILCLKDTNLK